jgi:hypothetical protein
MDLFNNLMDQIKCESIEGLWWELQDLYEDISKLDIVREITIQKENNIYVIKIFSHTTLSLNEIDNIVFPYIKSIRYHNGIFYERKVMDSQVCYKMITFREDYHGFACKIIILTPTI